MVVKKIVLSVLTVALITSQLAGCAMLQKDELLDMISNGDTITIEMTVPNWTPDSAKQLADLSWEELAQSQAYITTGFRGSVDTALNINTVTTKDGNTKQGCMYTVVKNGEEVQSGNTSMRDAFRNKAFIKYWNDGNAQNSLTEAVDYAYTDIDHTSQYALTAVLNAYYNLFNDGDNDTTYGATQSLTREQFMTMAFKAGNGVKELSDYTAFLAATGGKETYYTPYAAQMADHSFLKISNGSLNGTNIATPISKAEAVYMLVDTYLKSEVDKVLASGEKLSAFGYKDAGDQVAELGINADGTSKSVENNLLAYLVNNQGEKGIDHNLMAYLAVAEKYNLGNGIDLAGDLFSSISKDEAIRLLANTFEAENEVYGYLTNTEYGTLDTIEGNGLQVDPPAVEGETPAVEETPAPVEETPAPVDETPAPTQQKEQLFTDCSETMYATTTVNVRSSYSTNSDKLGSLTKAQSVKRTGIGTGAAAGWSRIEFNGKVAYVSSDYLSATKPQVNVSKPSTGSSSGSTQTSKPSSKPSTGGSGGSSSGGSSSGSTAPVPPGGSGSSGGSSGVGEIDMDELNDWMNDESQSGGWGSHEDAQHGFDPIDTQ